MSTCVPDELFARFKRLIQQHSGITLEDNRKRMLLNRVNVRMQQLKLWDLAAYYEEVVRDATGEELDLLIDSMTTNYTSFFRDTRQFDALASELKKLLSQSRRRIRLWSAACSTGEELYSIAITASEVAKECNEPMLRYRFLGTDIAQSVLESTYRGVYKMQAIAPLTSQQKSYFGAVESPTEPNSVGQFLQVQPEIRRKLILRKFNLCDAVWEIPDGIDCIFLRNVLLYFDIPTQKRILHNAYEKLAPGGLLFVGATESVRQYMHYADAVEPSVFRRRAGSSTSAKGMSFLPS